jgi:hypothetical protein
MSSEVDRTDLQRQPGAIIFESYGWDDAKVIANRIKDSLREAGFSVWIDREHIKHDETDFWTPLEQALDKCELVVALLSPYSGRREGDVEHSPWMSICNNELIMAVRMNKTVVSVAVIECRPPLAIVHYDPIDFTNWQTSPEAYRAGIDEILHWIREGLSKPTPRRRYSVYVDNLSRDRLSFPEELFAKDSFVGRGWLMDQLRAWVKRQGERCFLIEAEPGTGKTALAAELVRNDQDRILAYHFCNSQNDDTINPRRFVRSIAAMLSGNVSAYRERLRDVDFVSPLRMDNDPTTMLWQGVLAPLHDARMDGEFYIVVDGLDEAVDTPEKSIPQLLSEQLDNFPPWLKLVVTTRQHDRVLSWFQHAERCVLGDSESRQEADLREYIARRLTGSRYTEEGARGRILAIIAKRSAGNFQYATTVLEELNRGSLDVAEVERLPGSLAKLYDHRAAARFAAPGDFGLARKLLGVLLAARQPLTRDQLARVTGLDRLDELAPLLDRLNCFVTWDTGSNGERVYRVTHKSMGDWLTEPLSGSDRFRVDLSEGRELILAHCRKWEAHHEPYALTHLIAHLLEDGFVGEAQTLIRDGFFRERRAFIDPRQDLDDTRSLTLALVANKDQVAILELAHTDNVWQRDGVASGLQAADARDNNFVDSVVGALLN